MSALIRAASREERRAGRICANCRYHIRIDDGFLWTRVCSQISEEEGYNRYLANKRQTCVNWLDNRKKETPKMKNKLMKSLLLLAGSLLLSLVCTFLIPGSNIPFFWGWLLFTVGGFILPTAGIVISILMLLWRR